MQGTARKEAGVKRTEWAGLGRPSPQQALRTLPSGVHHQALL